MLCLSAMPAVADEAWILSDGTEVTWDQDADGVSIFGYDVGNSGERFRFYVPGLVDAIENRGTFYGYWIGPSTQSRCSATLTGTDGTTSDTFGQAVITFDRRTFPSAWSALIGQCFDTPSDEMRAEPK